MNTINRNPIEISQVQAQEFLATIPEDASGAVKYRITFDGQKLTAAKVIPASGEKISEFFSNIKKVFFRVLGKELGFEIGNEYQIYNAFTEFLEKAPIQGLSAKDLKKIYTVNKKLESLGEKIFDMSCGRNMGGPLILARYHLENAIKGQINLKSDFDKPPTEDLQKQVRQYFQTYRLSYSNSDRFAGEDPVGLFMMDDPSFLCCHSTIREYIKKHQMEFPEFIIKR